MKLMFVLLIPTMASALKLSVDAKTKAENPDLKMICSPGVKCDLGVTKSTQRSFSRSTIKVNGQTTIIVSDGRTWTATNENKSVLWKSEPFKECGVDADKSDQRSSNGVNGKTTYVYASGFSFSIDTLGKVVCHPAK